VVDTTGDNLMAEFTSAVDAVNCAVEIQRELAERNSELPDDRKMQFRIGVNVGDVVEEGDRIYGDGVNIAARVEGLADAGGIGISGRVYDQVENKLDFKYEYIGEQAVKNISKPVRLYKVLVKSDDNVSNLVKKHDLPDKPSLCCLSIV
jgi:adenylate cyclase